MGVENGFLLTSPPGFAVLGVEGDLFLAFDHFGGQALWADKNPAIDPVLQTSLLLPEPSNRSGQRRESSAKHLAAHKLFLQFKTVVILREQVLTAGCPRLRGFLRRLRNGEQTELNFQRLCHRLYTPSSQPVGLNMAAVVQWVRAHGKHISIFVARHDTESGKRLRVEELRGMPVVVTRNQFIGLKVVNGAPFKAVDIFPDLSAGAIALASYVTLHLGPPVVVLLPSDDSAGLAIPGLPNGTILVRSGRVAALPGFRWVTHRTGPLCTAAFAMTDQKSQGKSSFMSLYVQLSRAEKWSGLHLFRKPARGDFIEPKNVLDKDMKDAILKRFEQGHGHEAWFQECDATAESTQAAEGADEEDASLWTEVGS
ncbi:hypothetical protein N658DRAFT_569463 [Parathielavia hyrcaniae]|uniref:Uncharacterized protein n=1 Tax=Parathielavia hyrcaniae TaxID=113614 RepID=A0AAN6PUB6_9PEZI|nr:hypothetical protein N658DRAFT_569463 [Parathielavia hyrcaniae]